MSVFLVNIANSQENTKPFPRFRHVDAEASAPKPASVAEIRLMVEEDFAPWSFRQEDGELTGISVELAKLACEDAGMACEFIAKPFTDLLPALERGEGDVIVSGLRVTPEIAAQVAATRPYFQSLARFVTRIGTPIAAPDVRTLAGLRLGYAKGTTHGAFLEKYYSRSALIPFASEQEMFEALRIGGLDIAFGDAMRTIFWLNAATSRGCCMPLGGAFIDQETFTQPLVFLARRDMTEVRDQLDFALDRLEETGQTGKVFVRFLPGSVW